MSVTGAPPLCKRRVQFFSPIVHNRKKRAAINYGDIICISIFETALLDLPIKSPKDNAELIFVAVRERIPPLGTKVVVILEPILEAKKQKR